MIFISIVSGFLLLSTITLEGVTLKLILGISFLGLGALALYRLDMAYLAFLFLFPLVPSRPEQVGLPLFHFEEFLLLTLGFWWSLKNVIGRRSEERRGGK